MIRVAIVGYSETERCSFLSRASELTCEGFEGLRFEWEQFDDPELLVNHRPDAVVQLVDSADLDESLVMVPQLIDMHLKLVLAFANYDKLLATGHSIDFQQLGHLMGVQALSIGGISSNGAADVVRCAVAAAQSLDRTSRHIHVAYGVDIETAIRHLLDEVAKIPNISDSYSKRYLAIRLLERPELTLALLRDAPNLSQLALASEKNRRFIETELRQSPAVLIHEARHGFIHGALNATLAHSDDDSDHTPLEKVDKVLTSKLFGLPILAAVLYAVFQVTFTLGAYPQEWIQAGIDRLADLLRGLMPEAWYSSLLIDGVVQGVGAVLSFLPNIVILFFFISLMEDTGYMARVAFLMDKLMHRLGLHGKSFVPMLVGFGCNVPAIMAARSISNRKDRTLTMLMIPFMSCGARLPVYMLVVGAVFRQHQALVMMSLYLVGVLLSIVFALIMKRTRLFRHDDNDEVCELPAFRKPLWHNTWLHIWERCEDYLKKISTVILWASIVIWALCYFPRHDELTAPLAAQAAAVRQSPETCGGAASAARLADSLDFECDAVQKENSALAAVGRWLEPVMKPLGFDWRMNVCLLTGLPAKEAIVSTMGILYHQDSDAKLEESLRSNPAFAPPAAAAFLIFVLLYFPCIATVATLRREIGRGWAAFTVVHSLLLAWALAFLVFRIGSLLFA